MPPIDSALVSKACKGDRNAHAKLYELCSPMVYTLAKRMLVSKAMAEDVLQETFIEVIGKIDTYRGESGFAFWVRRIAVNKCLMTLRSAWNSRRLDLELTDDICPKTDGEPVGEQLDLEYALTKLSATSRAVVWLHDVEGYTHKEIGQMMDRTTSFSKSQLARAHERLRGLLDDQPLEDEKYVCM